MLPIAIGGIGIGYALGVILKVLLFSKSKGANPAASLLIAIASTPIVIVAFAVFLETQYGITGVSVGAKTGPAALFFAGGLYYGIRRRSNVPVNSRPSILTKRCGKCAGKFRLPSGKTMDVKCPHCGLTSRISTGFYPVNADTSKKADDGQKGVSCPSEESSAKNSSERLLS